MFEKIKFCYLAEQELHCEQIFKCDHRQKSMGLDVDFTLYRTMADECKYSHIVVTRQYVDDGWVCTRQGCENSQDIIQFFSDRIGEDEKNKLSSILVRGVVSTTQA